MDYFARQQRVQETLRSQRLDILLVTHLPNIRYLCGFTGSSGVLMTTKDGSSFFTDGRYSEQAREEIKGAEVVVSKKSPLIAAAGRLAGPVSRGRNKAPTGRTRGRRTVVVGIESEHLSVAARSSLQRLSSTRAASTRAISTKASLRDTSGIVEKERMLKDAAEIAQIRAAVLLGSSLFDGAVSSVRSGATEAEVAAELEYAARRAGAEGMSFSTIVAAGPRSALPHARASSHRITNGGFVVLDFGVILAGYCSDMTRTLYVGRPTTEARLLYKTVREAQLAGVEAVRPGVTVGAVDGAVRRVLRRAGLARYFTHSTGHGVGLEIHEAPRIAAGQDLVLQAGMVITIEPGIYIPGSGGVRIEDMVLVTGSGCEVLTPTTKELIAVE